MGFFDRFKNKKEIAATSVAETEDEEELSFKTKKEKKNFFDKLFGVADTAKGIKDSFDEVYGTWIKPIHTNWPQIKRRLSLVSTLVSLFFFIIYVPLVFFGKIADGLALGWQVALYVCAGLYAVMLIAMTIALIATGRASSTKKSRTRRLIYKIVKLIVRILAVAVSITALVISAEAEPSAIKTIAMIVAIVSIIFSVLPLMFGGMAGFCKWLISPAPSSIKRDFSFVALEWKQTLSDMNVRNDKVLKKGLKKHGDRLEECLDKYLLPQLGQKKIRSLDGNDILGALSCVPSEDINLTEWITKQIFAYAEDAGYIEENPCEGLGLEGDLAKELKRH